MAAEIQVLTLLAGQNENCPQNHPHVQSHAITICKTLNMF